MTTAFTPEKLLALAASLRLWALAFCAWLAETFDHAGMRRALREDVVRA